MKLSFFLRVTLLTSFMLLFAFADLPAVTDAPQAPEPQQVLAVMERVADWHLANPARRQPDGWNQTTGYLGILALSNLSSHARFTEAMVAMGQKNQWRPGNRVHHADDHCVGQAYAELYFKYRDPAMLAPLQERLDYAMANPQPGSFEFVGPGRNDRWSWCDALFMAPPAFIRLWSATGDYKYLDYLIARWWETSEFLYDKEEGLFYRDSNFFPQREANGKKIFWSRGNGWVLGGLARVLQYLPANHPAREKFEQQFRALASRVVSLQQPDGFWRATLLDPKSYPQKEESGTALFCYGLAWGMNQGLLDSKTYREPVLRAWTALASCVQADGKVINVQPIGAAPTSFDPNTTEPYGSGAFLLAASEMFRLGLLPRSVGTVSLTNHGTNHLNQVIAEISLPTSSGDVVLLSGVRGEIIAPKRVGKKLEILIDIAAGDTQRFFLIPKRYVSETPFVPPSSGKPMRSSDLAVSVAN